MSVEPDEKQTAPDPVIHVTDQGLTSPEPTPSTSDSEPSSSLGGGTATRTMVPEERE